MTLPTSLETAATLDISPYIIGLHGLPGVGKDTIADYLCEHYGFIKRAFADPLYVEVSRAFSIYVEDLCNRETKETPTQRLCFKRCADIRFISAMRRHLRNETADELMTNPRSPRQVLQWWGTEFRRRSDPNYWANKMRGYIDNLPETGRLVIPDVRFSDEATVVLSYPHLNDGLDYATTHRVIFEVLGRTPPAPSTHVSDQRLSTTFIRGIIANDEGFAELHTRIDAWMRRVFPTVRKNTESQC